MKITENQLRKLVREQVERHAELGEREQRYIAQYAVSRGVDEDRVFDDDESSPDYVGVIVDDRAQGWETPFDDYVWVGQVTPEVAKQAYDDSSHYKKGPAVIPTGWFILAWSDFGGAHVDGPYGSHQEAKSAAIDLYPEMITSDDVRDAPPTETDEEIGF